MSKAKTKAAAEKVTVVASTKITPSLDARVDALRVRYETRARESLPGSEVSRSDVLRAVILTGVTALEKEPPRDRAARAAVAPEVRA